MADIMITTASRVESQRLLTRRRRASDFSMTFSLPLYCCHYRHGDAALRSIPPFRRFRKERWISVPREGLDAANAESHCWRL